MKSPATASFLRPGLSSARRRASFLVALTLMNIFAPGVMMACSTTEIVPLAAFEVKEDRLPPPPEPELPPYVDPYIPPDIDLGDWSNNPGTPANPEQCNDVNAFTVFDGNARRTSIDLNVFGAASKDT